MNLHEYQGKELLASYGVAIQKGKLAHTVEEAAAGYEQLKSETGTKFCVVKAQIHAGGRGKGGKSGSWNVRMNHEEHEVHEENGTV